MDTTIIKSRRFITNPNMSIGLILAIVLVCIMFFGESLIRHDPFQIDMNNRLQGASLIHWLGTDQLGRDVFSRIVYGAKLTIGLGIVAIVMAVMIGIPIGLFSGYLGGRIDAFFMRVIDGVLAFPDFILAIAIAGILGPSLTNIVIAIVLVRWIVYARVVRGLVLAEKEKEYVQVSKISYSSSLKTIRMHIVPQIIPDIIVMATIDVGKVILLISALSYIGLGAQPPLPEWGAMLNDGRTYFQVEPTLMIYPGLAIMITVLCCNLLGDGLKSYFDIRN
ncbi:nickel transporter permease [Halalkalibacter krulwichiae]|uniref:Putative D,D-dipeptide transport system permease protein DdpC n=1 Tax=Halalkalibacter krulwichiae TaxID=199441 RepID=A0A1X9MFJ4_9BACI|nr:nickel transporter permease [Halalkalibacter krulwichiae]ARK30873.1 putative D,D-dipeptide transport system permease protein DdpC [Halalkalibacter krulwichiae]